MTLIDRIGMDVPLIQAPMAGVSTPALAAAVTNAGGLGSLGLGASTVAQAREMIAEAQTLTAGPLNLNVFVHEDPTPDAAREGAWLDALRPVFQRFAAEPPNQLETIYTSFRADPAMCALLVETAPAVVSFHFGLPTPAQADALRRAGCVLIASATSLDEARAVRDAGLDAVVAQGYEAGGHRGVFDADAKDQKLGTEALTRQLVAESGLPVIAAGGVMDGARLRALLNMGAVAVQLGTAFVPCPESAADSAYRTALARTEQTVMTRAISGRPARCLVNDFTEWGTQTMAAPPAYPRAYDAGKALNAAAKAKGATGFGAQWSGTGAGSQRAMPAADLVRTLAREAGL